MGLLGAGNFKTCKFKNLAKLSLSRIAILNKQHNARCSYARSDVVELLRRGHLDKALARVTDVSACLTLQYINMLPCIGADASFYHKCNRLNL